MKRKLPEKLSVKSATKEKPIDPNSIGGKLQSGEIIDTSKLPFEVQALLHHIYFDSGESFRPNPRLSQLEIIQGLTQEELDEMKTKSSFLSAPEQRHSDSFLGLPPQFLKKDSPIYKSLIDVVGAL